LIAALSAARMNDAIELPASSAAAADHGPGNSQTRAGRCDTQSRSNSNSRGESIAKRSLRPLPCFDAQQHALGIRVRHLQRHELSETLQSGAIGGAQRGLYFGLGAASAAV